MLPVDSLVYSLECGIAGLLIGVAIGLTGIGGGALIQPALIQVLGLNPVVAVGTGLGFAVLTKLGGAISHFRLGNVRPRRAVYFLLGALPAIVTTAHLVNRLHESSDPRMLASFMQTAMAAVLFFTALVIIIQALFLERHLERKRELYPPGGSFPAHKVVTAMASGALVGGIMGLTSVGGGVLIIPIFMLFLECSASEAVGSSVVISLFLSIAGGVVYLVSGQVEMMTLLLLCVGSFPGVWLGSRFSRKIPEKVLKSLVIGLMIFSGLSLLTWKKGH